MLEGLFEIPVVREVRDFPLATHCPGDSPGAVGLNLTAELMLGAYTRGLFAWSERPVTWWSPDPRAIFDFDDFHISRRLKHYCKNHPYIVTIDQDFQGVLEGCAGERANGEGTWIGPSFQWAFMDLFEQGFAHSVECWYHGNLVGGVFGVAIGGLFSAESMFRTMDNASKIALLHLRDYLKNQDFSLLDIQVINPFTRSMGAKELDRDEYLKRLRYALNQRISF